MKPIIPTDIRERNEFYVGIVMGLVILDILSSWFFLSKGYPEGNPVFRLLLDNGMWLSAFLVKILICGLSIFGMWALANHYMRSRKQQLFLYYSIWVVIGFYSVVVLMNFLGGVGVFY